MNLPTIKITLIAFVLGLVSCNKSVDIRNDYLKNGITDETIQKGKELLLKMEEAHGGSTIWEKYKLGAFSQKADWYGRLKLSHWDTLPQQYHMVCELGSDNAEMTLLNGKNKGVKYKIQSDLFSEQKVNQAWKEIARNKFYEKMIFKNYWFQFPFRIREASIISYGGQAAVNGTQYHILYATWGTAEANPKYDQFLLYLNSSTYRLELLHFTVRDKMRSIKLTAEFKNFKRTNGLLLPHSQFVRYGKPENRGIKLHENHYWDITFG